MTESEWWQEIERFTLAKDSNGLLVAADGLQELGEDSMADTVRWVAKKLKSHSSVKIGYVWDHPKTGVGKKNWYGYIFGDRFGGVDCTCRDVYRDIDGHRQWVLEYYR